jgi:hypothetical protein
MHGMELRLLATWALGLAAWDLAAQRIEASFLSL